MRHLLTRSDNARSRAPGWGWYRALRAHRRSRKARSAPARTMFASGLAVWLCALAACVLSMPGFVLGAEGTAPQTSAETSTPAAVAVTPGMPTSNPAVSAGTVLATLPWGDGQGEVGLAEPGEGLARGPEAVAVAPDGRIAILDSVNRRLVFLDNGGGFVGSIPVPLNEPRFLAVTDDSVFVLDCDRDRRLVTLAWTGKELARTDLPVLEDVVTGLFATERGPCVEVAHESTYLMGGDEPESVGRKLPALPGRPLDRGLSRVAKATFSPDDGLSVATAAVDERTLKSGASRVTRPALARGRALEHLISIDGDGSGGLIVGARLVTDDGQDGDGATANSSVEQPALVLTRLAGDFGRGPSDPSGRAPSAATETPASDELLLADSGFTYLGQPYVVAPDGRVLQPVADETGYRLLVHTFASVEEVQP